VRPHVANAPCSKLSVAIPCGGGGRSTKVLEAVQRTTRPRGRARREGVRFAPSSARAQPRFGPLARGAVPCDCVCASASAPQEPAALAFSTAHDHRRHGVCRRHRAGLPGAAAAEGGRGSACARGALSACALRCAPRSG
jgi:hypothetical protein